MIALASVETVPLSWVELIALVFVGAALSCLLILMVGSVLQIRRFVRLVKNHKDFPVLMVTEQRGDLFVITDVQGNQLWRAWTSDWLKQNVVALVEAHNIWVWYMMNRWARVRFAAWTEVADAYEWGIRLNELRNWPSRLRLVMSGSFDFPLGSAITVSSDMTGPALVNAITELVITNAKDSDGRSEIEILSKDVPLHPEGLHDPYMRGMGE